MQFIFTFLRTVPLNTKVYVGEADPSEGFSNPKRKLGVTSHFSEIIKQQLECVFFLFGELYPISAPSHSTASRIN